MIGHILKNKQKSMRVFIRETRIIKMKMKMKNRSHRYGKNRATSRQGHKHTK